MNLEQSPLPCLCAAQEQEGERNKNEIEPSKKGEVGERCL